MEIQNEQAAGAEVNEGDLLAMAMKADAGELPESTTEAEPNPDSQSEATEKQEQAKPEAKKPDGEAPKVDDPAKEPETKPEDESKYTKAKKEQERRDRSWQKLEEEKAALRAEKEAIAKEKEEAERAKATAKKYRDEHGYSAEDYEAFAKTADDPDLAERARKKAAEIRAKEQEVKSNSARDEFVSEWNKNLNAVLEETPDLKNEESDIGKELKKVLSERKVFSMAPDGIKHAVEFVKAQRQAGLVSGLEAKVKDLETEIARLNKLTGLTPSGPSARPGMKSFDDLSPAEQEAELMRQAEAADRAA